MPFVTLRQLLDDAAEHGYGHPAFNVSDMEQILAVMRAARAARAPVILQASRSARAFAGERMLQRMVEAAVETHPEVPVCLHLDHGNGSAACLSAIQHGSTSVMMDGSLAEDGRTPNGFEENTAVTAAVVRLAHAVGVSVEGELGVLGSLETGTGEAEDGHGAQGVLSRDQLLTDPAEARAFVERTGVDALAVAIGTSHGAYKFSRRPTGDLLALDRIEAIAAAVPGTHLVMHGSSSVPQELQDLFNEHGGEMPQTWGVPVEGIVDAIRRGVRKVNIDTDLRMAAVAQWRRVAATEPGQFDVRAFMRPAMEATERVCLERLEAFGAAGRAPGIAAVPLAAMAERYSDAGGPDGLARAA